MSPAARLSAWDTSGTQAFLVFLVVVAISVILRYDSGPFPQIPARPPAEI